MMLSRHLLAAPLALSLSLVASVAHADPASDDHFEATMGFLAMGLDHTASGFIADGHNIALADAFRAAPYNGVTGYGLRYDVRLVLSHVRMTAGLDLPFTSLGNRETQRVDEHEVTPRELHAWAVRFGLGAEYRIGAVTPFVDLIGSLMHASTTLTVDGTARDYTADRFGFTARGGLRLDLRRYFFVMASGEYGLVGAARWGADVSAGFRFGV